jgi:transcriptional regulator with XRE-family HTH domain
MTQTDLRKILGQKVREIRKQADLTQEELAKKIKIYQNDLSTFENRGKKLGMEKIAEIFKYFGLELIIDYQVTVSEKKRHCSAGRSQNYGDAKAD